MRSKSDTTVAAASGDLPNILSCGCVGGHRSDERFYTSARRDDGRTVALAGPYATHDDALAALSGDKQRVWDSGDPKAPWYAYGTFGAMAGANVRPVFGERGEA
jgi:hypothetical protein